MTWRSITSRIHWIRHPSPANTHQSLCAHNLITKHITAAKQPRYSDPWLLMRAKNPQLFLLLKTCQLEDCGGVSRVVVTYYYYYHHHHDCILAGFSDPGGNTLPSFLSGPSWLVPILSISLFFCRPVSLRSVARGPRRGENLVRAGQTDLPLSANYECDLVNSPQRRRFHFKRVAVRGLNTACLLRSHSDTLQ